MVITFLLGAATGAAFVLVAIVVQALFIDHYKGESYEDARDPEIRCTVRR